MMNVRSIGNSKSSEGVTVNSSGFGFVVSVRIEFGLGVGIRVGIGTKTTYQGRVRVWLRVGRGYI